MLTPLKKLSFCALAFLLIAPAIAVILAPAPARAQARDEIQIAGSSTVLPFAIVVAEEYGLTYPDNPTPVVASGGTGGGFRLFCQGVGAKTIDIANASRHMKDLEREACAAAGVSDFIEIKFGYDGIVLAGILDQPDYTLTTAQIWRAIAAQVPINGVWQANPYTRWSDIDPDLPDRDITLFIPGENHGTREVFEVKILMDGCKTLPLVTAMDKKQQSAACLKLRTDGRSVDITGDYAQTIARINSSKTGLGVFGINFIEQNLDSLKTADINGVPGTMEEIVAGRYPVFRPLFFYVKTAHLAKTGEIGGVVKGLADYVELFLSEDMASEDGLLAESGLIPLTKEERTKTLRQFRAQSGNGAKS